MINCTRCGDTGIYWGNGMVTTDCDCKRLSSKSNNVDNDLDNVDKTNVVIDKRSKEYKTAIKEIRALHPSISIAQAAKMFEEQFNKS